MRTVTVSSTQRSGATQIQTSAYTWGELKETLHSKGFNDVGNMRAVVRETKVDLSSDNAQLPEGDFTLLLTPRQIKAGSSSVDVVRILEALKGKFSSAIDELIEEVEDGEYDKASVAKKVTTVQNNLQKDLEDLKNGTI